MGNRLNRIVWSGTHLVSNTEVHPCTVSPDIIPTASDNETHTAESAEGRRSGDHKSQLLESPQTRPHWLLLIYSFQFRSAARAVPARAAPTSVAHLHCCRYGFTDTCGFNNGTPCLKKTSHLWLAITLTHMNGFWYFWAAMLLIK